MTSAAFC